MTEAMYATDLEGNRTELAIFFNDLTSTELDQLASGINEFELKLLRDPEFRRKVYLELSDQSK